ncbi:hypothetical protein Desku_1242 [Desulfofundulus kuznetsovii DSM 6115]|jgi:hypothetical protein|uniref:Uncharacterized protein n=1 Tax=Desulfofundulus kuznetsovii (strain DSM 6115 / VKM B-1805 / 17) TaxID=760568 RepID=A0AAU8PBW2_DESK7|nr:hypothetical protein Desku_1242 [Desulfofundulus kuznetsovii DSM 6115]
MDWPVKWKLSYICGKQLPYKNKGITPAKKYKRGHLAVAFLMVGPKGGMCEIG